MQGGRAGDDDEAVWLSRERQLQENMKLKIMSNVSNRNLLNIVKFNKTSHKRNQSHYRPEVPRSFQEFKIPRLSENGTGWW